MRPCACLLALVLGLVLLPGCGGPAMAPVKGRVTCKGSPVKEAALTFSPVPRSADDKEPGKPATGFTDANGHYELSTFRELDGALVGKHRVLVTLDDTNPCRCTHTKRLELEVKPGDNQLDIELNQ
jgi:hypothetical protein